MKKANTAVLGIAAIVVASLAVGVASPANAAIPSDAVVAGLIPDGTVYVSGDDGLFHQVDSATLASLGLAGKSITWYGELPGSVGDPATATAKVASQSLTVAGTSAVLAGLLTDGTVYIAGDDGLWHPIDAATLAARGLSTTWITWYGQLPGSVGDPVPA
jgi:hypothetical protein